MFLLKVIGCVLLVYGLLSLVQDIFDEITYKKICHDMKMVIFAKGIEKNLDNFIIELYNIKKLNCYKQIVVIDLDKKDDIEKIKTRFINNEVNVDILNWEEGKEYSQNFFQDEKLSFL